MRSLDMDKLKNSFDAFDGGRARTDKPVAALFNPLTTAMRSNRQRVEITLLDEPDDSNHVQIEHEGRQHKMYLTGVVLWELKKWACMKRPLKNTVVVIRYKHGSPRPEVDIVAGDSGGRAGLL